MDSCYSSMFMLHPVLCCNNLSCLSLFSRKHRTRDHTFKILAVVHVRLPVSVLLTAIPEAAPLRWFTKQVRAQSDERWREWNQQPGNKLCEISFPTKMFISCGHIVNSTTMYCVVCTTVSGQLIPLRYSTQQPGSLPCPAKHTHPVCEVHSYTWLISLGLSLSEKGSHSFL